MTVGPRQPPAGLARTRGLLSLVWRISEMKTSPSFSIISPPKWLVRAPTGIPVPARTFWSHTVVAKVCLGRRAFLIALPCPQFLWHSYATVPLLSTRTALLATYHPCPPPLKSVVNKLSLKKRILAMKSNTYITKLISSTLRYTIGSLLNECVLPLRTVDTRTFLNADRSAERVGLGGKSDKRHLGRPLTLARPYTSRLDDPITSEV